MLTLQCREACEQCTSNLGNHHLGSPNLIILHLVRPGLHVLFVDGRFMYSIYEIQRTTVMSVGKP